MASAQPPDPPDPMSFEEAVDRCRTLGGSVDPGATDDLLAAEAVVLRHIPTSLNEAARMLDVLMEDFGERSDALNYVALDAIRGLLRTGGPSDGSLSSTIGTA